MSTQNSNWKRAQFACDQRLSSDEVEGLALELVDIAGGYTEILTQNKFVYFWDSRTTADPEVHSAFESLGIKPSIIEVVADENWTQKCEELLEPVVAADVIIQPYASAPTEPRTAPNEIAIIPGQGFGTGHHDTTRTIVELLVELRNQGKVFSTAIDVGTGSGILAIAAAKLFRSRVDAMDNDPDAIENARDNVAMNGCSGEISLSTADLPAFEGPYDLILANIYAEVLVSFSREFDRLSRIGSILVVSGITKEKKGLVQSALLQSNLWEVQRWRETSSWCSGSFERVR